jgi:hypothetical protein
LGSAIDQEGDYGKDDGASDRTNDRPNYTSTRLGRVIAIIATATAVAVAVVTIIIIVVIIVICAGIATTTAIRACRLPA